MDKKQAYSEKRLVEGYDSRRFGGEAGKYVNKREQGIVRSFLEGEKGPFLDMACGTGRFSGLFPKGLLVGMDFSREMLMASRGERPLVRGDAFRLPFRDKAFGAVVAGRLFQHYKDIKPLLKEMKRISKGPIIFDTLRWSPRNLVPTKSGRVYPHSRKEIESFSGSLGLRIERTEECFLFSPGIYRFLPKETIRPLDRIEKKTPDRLKVRVFYKLRPNKVRQLTQDKSSCRHNQS